ncbi:hypothetical protein Tco_0615899 [Tanacetum coccineum]
MAAQEEASNAVLREEFNNIQIDDSVPMDSKEGGKKVESSKEEVASNPDEDRAVNYEVLAIKYPIVDWESQILGSNLQGNDLSYWKITRADRSTKFYKIFTEMLEDFDSQGLVDLHKLVKERSTSRALEDHV